MNSRGLNSGKVDTRHDHQLMFPSPFYPPLIKGPNFMVGVSKLNSFGTLNREVASNH